VGEIYSYTFRDGNEHVGYGSGEKPREWPWIGIESDEQDNEN